MTPASSTSVLRLVIPGLASSLPPSRRVPAEMEAVSTGKVSRRAGIWSSPRNSARDSRRSRLCAAEALRVTRSRPERCTVRSSPRTFRSLNSVRVASVLSPSCSPRTVLPLTATRMSSRAAFNDACSSLPSRAARTVSWAETVAVGASAPIKAFQSAVSRRLIASLKVESGNPWPDFAHERAIG